MNSPDVTVSQRFKTRFHRLDFDAQDSHRLTLLSGTVIDSYSRHNTRVGERPVDR